MVDVLLASDHVMHLSDSIYNPEEYTLLTDSIIKEIERTKNPDLKASRDIIKRIRSRDLYDFVDQIIIPPSFRQVLTKEQLNKQDILRYQDPGSNLKDEDIIIDW